VYIVITLVSNCVKIFQAIFELGTTNPAYHFTTSFSFLLKVQT